MQPQKVMTYSELAALCRRAVYERDRVQEAPRQPTATVFIRNEDGSQTAIEGEVKEGVHALTYLPDGNVLYFGQSAEEMAQKE